MNTKEAFSTVLTEINVVIGTLDQRQLGALIEDILAAERVFVMGAGRVRYLLKCFAKRLSHAGVDVHVIGETTTPPIAAGDLLLVASCSGSTATPLAVATKAHVMGLRLCGITGNADSPIARQCHRLVVIPCAGDGGSGSRPASLQPMNNLFEQALHLVVDVVSWAVQEEKGVSPAALWERHANIE